MTLHILHDLMYAFFKRGIRELITWLKYRKVDFQICRLTNQIDVKTLTFDQRLAYDIVDSHVKLSSEQLSVIITGVSVTGKSYIINVIQNLLCEKCIVLAFF